MRMLLLVSLLAPLVADAATYKCEVDGRRAYQDHPCAGSASDANQIPLTQSTSGGVNMPQIQIVDPSEAAAKAAAKPAAVPQPACQRPGSGELSKALNQNRVLICMSKAEVLRSADRMTDHQVSIDETGAETWFFPAHWETFPGFVVFRDDRVAAIH